MGLTVTRVSFGNFGKYTQTKQITPNNSPEIPPSTDTTTGKKVDNMPCALHFGGFFFNRKKPVSEAKTAPEPIEQFGPMGITKKQMDANDTEAETAAIGMARCLSNQSKQVLRGEPYFPMKRATDKEIEDMVPVCIGVLTSYPTSKTSFPQYYDSMTRAFAKACIKADKDSYNDNASRLYEATLKRVKELGYVADPETQDPIKDGLAYLYFADNLPVFRFGKDQYSTEEVISDMQKGVMPKIDRRRMKAGVKMHPRCHLSTTPGEIKKYGTPNIRKAFLQNYQDKTGRTYPNEWGSRENLNYRITLSKDYLIYDFPDTSEPVQETINLEEFVGEILRGYW